MSLEPMKPNCRARKRAMIASSDRLLQAARRACWRCAWLVETMSRASASMIFRSNSASCSSSQSEKAC
eukprot:978753-Heterocapsa_arctica.AAC.1